MGGRVRRSGHAYGWVLAGGLTSLFGLWHAGRHRRGSERLSGDLVPSGDPLPCAELVGVGERAVVEPVAGVAGSPDRSVHLVQHRLVVDVHHPSAQPLGDALLAGQVRGRHGRHEAVVGPVGQLDCFVVISKGRDGRDRAEDLLVERGLPGRTPVITVGE